ncbi:hypothetical protein ACFLXQ_03280 [Chloroflexota bacterium]
MNEGWITTGISAILVSVEYVGILFAKWVASFRIAEKAGQDAMVKVDIEFDPNTVPPGQDPVQVKEKRMRDAGNMASIEVRRKKVFEDTLPGPELCFFALTIQVAISLVFYKAKPNEKAALLPSLAGSQNAETLILGAILLSIFFWLLSLVWREAILTNVQCRARIPSKFMIVMIGTVAVSITIYLLISGRQF